MARLTWSGWLGVIGVFLMLTLAVLPKTKWIVKLHGYVAKGDLHYGRNDIGSYDYKPGIEVYDLLRLIQPKAPEGENKELAGAILSRTTSDGDPRRERLAQLSAKYPNNALVQAAACRYLSMVTIPRPDKDGIIQPPKYPQKEIDKRQKFYAELAKCASRGMAAEPNNMFFDLELACAKVGQRKLDEARKVVHLASMKTAYNEHGFEECDLLIGLMSGSNSYGEYLQMQVYSSLLLPYLSNIKSMSICLAHTGTPEQMQQSRLDLLLIADTVSNKVDHIVGMLVMRAIAKIALIKTMSWDGKHHPTDAEYEEAGARMQPVADARFGKGLAPNLRSMIEKSNGFVNSVTTYADELNKKVGVSDPSAIPESPFGKLSLSVAVLLAFLFLLPAAAMQAVGQKIRKNVGAARALPLLVPLFVALLTPEFSEVLTGPNYASLMALSFAGILTSFALAWIPRFAKASLWIAIGVSALGLLYGAFVAIVGNTPFSWTLAIAAATLIAVLTSQDKGPQWLRSGIGAILLCSAVLWGILSLTMSSINSTEWLIAVLILMLAAFVGPIRPHQGRRIVGPALLVLAAVFALQCRHMSAIDQQAGQISRMYMNEANQVRQMAANIR